MKLTKKVKGIILALCIISFGLGVFLPKFVTSSTNEEQKKFDKIYQILTTKWYYSDDVKNLDDTLMEQAITGMTSLEKDPHTNYFDLDQAKAFSEELDGSTVGLGFGYYENDEGNLVLTNVYLNSTADQAGLQRGDIITGVDSYACKDGIKQVVKYIQSKANQTILVKFIRDGKDKMIKAKPQSFDATVVCEAYKDYGVITLTSFSSMTGKDFNKAMKRLSSQGIRKVIVDLRNNTGGYLNAAVDVASSLLPKGKVVVQEKDKDGKITKRKTNDAYQQVKMDKIILLQNDKTASASEALIGALKQQLSKKVTTVGTTTYGKGTEQEQVSFKDGTSMKYTVGKWLTPNGSNINEKGFKPDVSVEDEKANEVSYESFKKKDVIAPDTTATNAEALQVFLAYLGYDVDRTDMYFSPTSSEALKQFQSDNGIVASGSCDYTTWKKLLKKVGMALQDQQRTTNPQYRKAVEMIES